MTHCDLCDHECDLLVIGAGPAGFAAAVNAASEGLTTILHERVPDPDGSPRGWLSGRWRGPVVGVSGGWCCRGSA